MKIALTGLFLFACIILQLGLREVGYYISLSNIVLVYLCLLLLNYKLEEVLWMALGVGIIMDLLSGTPDGVMAISFPAGAAFAKYVGGIFFRERLREFLIPSFAVSATIGAVITGLLVLGVMSLLGWVYPPDGAYYLTWLLPVTALFSLLSLVPAYWLRQLELLIQKKVLPKNESL